MHLFNQVALGSSLHNRLNSAVRNVLSYGVTKRWGTAKARKAVHKLLHQCDLQASQGEMYA